MSILTLQILNQDINFYTVFQLIFTRQVDNATQFLQELAIFQDKTSNENKKQQQKQQKQKNVRDWTEYRYRKDFYPACVQKIFKPHLISLPLLIHTEDSCSVGIQDV